MTVALLPEKWDKETDVLIIGAGGAGLIAAIEACDAGANVLILEKTAAIGGATAMSDGAICAAGTKFQKQRGIPDSPDLWYGEFMKACKHEVIPELVRTVVDHAKDACDWLLDHGVEFVSLASPTLYSVPRVHLSKGAGGDFLRVFKKEVRKRPEISILVKTSARELIKNVNGEVIGVKAESEGKSTYIKAKRAVILASGGYAANSMMIMKHFPQFDRVLCYGFSGNTGDGILMGQKIGGDITHFAPRAHPWAFEVKPGRAVLIRLNLFAKEGSIFVNRDGNRFLNEDKEGYYGMLLPILLEQPGKVLFCIFDADIWDAILDVGVTIPDIKKIRVERGSAFRSAATIGELAEEIGLSANKLKMTIDTYNRYVDEGKDRQFKRRVLKKIEKPTFYALETGQGFGTTSGGLRVNNKAQVLDPYGDTIPRLYAAGETVGGVIWHVGYVSGSSIAHALALGLIAGKNAAAEKPLL